MPVAAGFPRQRLVVVPRPLVGRALRQPATAGLVVTDAGWFPEAADHYRDRPTGAREAVVIICSAGAGWCEIGGRRSAVRAGEVAVLPANLAHRYGASPATPWTIWWLHLTGTAVAELVRQAGGPRGGVGPAGDLARSVGLVDETLSLLEQGYGPAQVRAAAGCAWHLLTSLALPPPAPAPDPVERALAFMAERVAGSVTVGEVAAAVNLSPSHLAAVFRQTTGDSVLKHFTSLKMARARDLLETELTVAEVARRVGYADPFYFSRQFRRFHGTSPSTFRAERGRADR